MRSTGRSYDGSVGRNGGELRVLDGRQYKAWMVNTMPDWWAIRLNDQSKCHNRPPFVRAVPRRTRIWGSATLVVIHLVGINITGTSVNPARSTGPVIVGIGAKPLAMAQLRLLPR